MLSVNSLTKRLPDGTVLLNAITFTVEKGEFVGILGPSGAGKSLTMRCMVGLTSVSAGSVVFTGEQGRTYTTTTIKGNELRRARRNIGVIFQGSNLVKRLTVLENVMIGRLGRIHPLRSWLYGFTDREAEEALAALDRVGLASFSGRQTGSLSGGEMQRVAIARAIYQRPLCYLADEPIASLDPKNSRAIMKLLQPLARDHPIVGSFHQPDMTAEFCTRVLGLRNGTIVYDGPPRLTRAQLAEIYSQDLSLEPEETLDAMSGPVLGHPVTSTGHWL
ncbi:MAG TPA: phosphonate ABC transporter ATP-binding protein [Vicinamibacterales bacterium]|nr:phosphonate ABC transporter ATP-binding protein [Vicinamibacterales bacterium]